MGEEEGKSEARGGAMRKTFKVFHKTHDKQRQTTVGDGALERAKEDTFDKYNVALNQMKEE